MRMICRTILITVLLVVISVCGHELWKISRQYSEEAQIKDELSQYRPEIPETQSVTKYIKNTEILEDKKDIEDIKSIEDEIYISNTANDLPDNVIELPNTTFEEETTQSTVSEKIINQSIIDMQNEINNDIVGWLTIPNTKIDYPFVIAKDNDFYLRRNIYKNQAGAGSIFMDYRCDRDFTDFNTVIYGHEMKNRSMFGDLKLFADPSFFDSNLSGTLFIKDNTYTLEIFACMVVRADDKLIYNPSADRENFFAYAKKYARQYHEPSVAGNVVTLSTCAYEYDGARIVLLAVRASEEWVHAKE